MKLSYNLFASLVLLVLSVQKVAGDQDFAYHANENIDCDKEECIKLCDTEPDIAFAVDSSLSVQRKNFDLMKRFIVNVTKHFSGSTTSFAMLRFTFRTKVIFNFTESVMWNKTELEHKIMTVPYKSGSTRIDKALLEAEKKFFCPTCGRKKAKVLFMMTDGSNDSGTMSVSKVAEGLKAKNVTIISVGIGARIKRDELEKIATDKDHVFLIVDFNHLADKIHELVEVSCHTPQKPLEKNSTYCTWTEWSQWSLCSRTCGGGLRERYREIKNMGVDEKNCSSYNSLGRQTKSCNRDKCIEQCHSKVDIAFLVDSSLSVTRDNFELMKHFIVNVTRHFNDSDINFAMLRFAFRTKVIFNFIESSRWNHKELEKHIMQMQYQVGSTRIDKALLEAEKKFFCPTCGRKKAKVLFIMTDGSNDSGTMSVSKAAQGLKVKDVIIISIGIGNRINHDELKKIAADDKHVFIIADFKYLSDEINGLVALSCEEGNNDGV